MKPSQLTPDEKQAIVLAYLRGAKMANLAREHQVSATTIYNWRDAFLDGGLRSLEGDTPGKREKALERENEQLRETVSELALANTVLKKLRTRANGGRR